MHRGLVLKHLMSNKRRLRRVLEDGCVLLFFNLLFSASLLFSPSSQLPGFPHRQDVYWYMPVSQHLLELIQNGIAPFGVTWLRQTYCGLPEVVAIDPLYSVYLPLLVGTDSFVLCSRLTVFFFYVLSSVAMYYLAYVIVKERIACLVSSVAYTFTQVLVFEMFQGHLSMVSGFAFIPFVVAFYINAMKRRSAIWPILSGVFLSALAIMRPDFAYFTIFFLALLFFYYLIMLSSRVKSFTSTLVMFLIAFLLCYPLLEARYISKVGELAANVGQYNYQFYSPPLYLPFVPFISSQGAYLGISVVFYALLGGSVSLMYLYKQKRKSSENDRFFVFISVLALVFFAIGLGSSGPLYGFLDEFAPFFSAFRVPTRWFVITVLCLAVLAGKGSLHLFRMVRRESYKRSLKGLAVLLVFLDLSVFVAPIVYVQSGWQPLAGYGEDQAVFMFPQTSSVPSENMAYEYVSLDDAGSFRVLSAPIVYSESYYQYSKYLRDTNITFADNYVQFPSSSKFQADVYSGFRYGNFSETVGDQMALLGVKYLVYNFYWGEWTGLVAKMNRTRDLEFVVSDNGYILYRNKRFGNVVGNGNLMGNSGFEDGYTAWDPWHVNGGVSETDSALSHSGNASMRLTSFSSDEIAGRSQYVYLPKSELASEFKLSGWCKTENVSGPNPNCAARATIVYTDNSSSSAASAKFSSGTHDWEYSLAYFSSDPHKVVKYVVVSFFLRNATGAAWFDDFWLAEEKRTDEWDGGFAVKKLYSDVNALLSEGNKANATLSVVRGDPLSLRLEINTTEPCYVVVSESFDEGWRLVGDNSTGELSIQDYNGLTELFIPAAGTYDLSLKFMSYYDSFNRTLLFSSAAAVLIVFYYVVSLPPFILKLKAAERRLRHKPADSAPVKR